MDKDERTQLTFNSGTYEAAASLPVQIKTKVTIAENKIVDVTLRSLKKEDTIEPDLEEEYKGQIIDAQSVNIDGISGATVLTQAVKSAVGEALAEARKF